DLWIINHVMGIQQFSNKVVYDSMTRELNSAQGKDYKAKHESENATEHLRKLFPGTDAYDPMKTKLYPKLQKYSPWLREVFSLHVIHHTLNSIDYQGQKICEMRPYCEHVMLIELHDWEWREL
ncbi:hypothetical protein J3R82DRAFT_11613, partial [Butyriboletus roseoflavus]